MSQAAYKVKSIVLFLDCMIFVISFLKMYTFYFPISYKKLWLYFLLKRVYKLNKFQALPLPPGYIDDDR